MSESDVPFDRYTELALKIIMYAHNLPRKLDLMDMPKLTLLIRDFLEKNPD